MPVCVKKVRNLANEVQTKAFLQPANTDAMCTACHDYACPLPPVSPFLLAQNLSSTQTVPTDNVRSKLHDEIHPSSVVEGLTWHCPLL